MKSRARVSAPLVCRAFEIADMERGLDFISSQLKDAHTAEVAPRPAADRGDVQSPWMRP